MLAGYRQTLGTLSSHRAGYRDLLNEERKLRELQTLSLVLKAHTRRSGVASPISWQTDGEVQHRKSIPPRGSRLGSDSDTTQGPHARLEISGRREKASWEWCSTRTGHLCRLWPKTDLFKLRVLAKKVRSFPQSSR